VLNEVRKQFKLVSRQDHPVGFSIAKPPFSEWPSDVVVINATILGLKPEDILPLDVSLLGSNARIFDMTFQRGGTPKFVSAARDRGLRAADGLSMLVWQGTRALRLWTGFNEQEEPHIAQIMMNAACQALGLPPRHVS
jgi:shikimate dehydrogenase